MKKSTLIKVMSMFIIALCVFGTVTCNKTDDSTEEAKLMKSYPNSDGNFESDLCNYESDRLYIIREDQHIHIMLICLILMIHWVVLLIMY